MAQEVYPPYAWPVSFLDHPQTHNTRQDSSQTSLPDNTQHSPETDIVPRRDSNPQTQHTSGCRPLP